MLRIVVAPEITSEKLEAIKLHLRVDHDEEDELIKTLINATREYAENTLCERAFEVQKLELVTNVIANEINLPRPPLVSVDGVYVETDGIETEASYSLVSVGEPALVIIKDSLVNVDKIRIEYTAGYHTPPAEYLLWQKLMVAHYYENRQAILPLGHNIMKTPFTADYLLQSYRMFGVV